jgi:hypothetical protein
MFNRCIIVGGGASIRNNQWNLSGYDIPLWKIIKNECLFTLNWSYLFVKPTISFYSDYQFYYTNKEDLDKILMVISLDDGYYHREQVTKPEKNIFLLKPNSHYYGNKSWKEGWYSKQLVGIFALNFAIQCGFKEIYLCYDKETEVFTWK